MRFLTMSFGPVVEGAECRISDAAEWVGEASLGVIMRGVIASERILFHSRATPIAGSKNVFVWRVRAWTRAHS
jgi:hypothetical protein